MKTGIIAVITLQPVSRLPRQPYRRRNPSGSVPLNPHDVRKVGTAAGDITNRLAKATMYKIEWKSEKLRSYDFETEKETEGEMLELVASLESDVDIHDIKVTQL